MTPQQLERYKRHLLVKEIGGPGQQKLLRARIIIVGAGALGGQMAITLAAAGIGFIQIFDDDRVDLSNLQRQTHFVTSDVGALKVDALKARIASLNPGVEIDAVSERWSPEHSMGDANIILDGTDNFESRFEINRWSRQAGVPFVSGAVAGWQGQSLLVNVPDIEACPCYQCYVPEAPPQAGDCNDRGVVGAVTTLTANHMAMIALQYILGLQPKPGRLWLMDGLGDRTRNIALPQDPNCPVCSILDSA